MSDDAAMTVVGLGAFCDVSGAPRRDRREAHFDVSEFAGLDDGRRITLHKERGFSGRLSFDADAWLYLTSDGLKRDVLNAVLPDEDDTGDEHPWEWLVELCRARGIVATVEELKGVLYEVVLSDRVRSRLTTTSSGRGDPVPSRLIWRDDGSHRHRSLNAGRTSLTGIEIIPNEMVPLQIDLAIGVDGTCWCAQLTPGGNQR